MPSFSDFISDPVGTLEDIVTITMDTVSVNYELSGWLIT